MKNQSLHLLLLGGFSLLLLLSFCFTFQGFKQNREVADSAFQIETEVETSARNVSDTVRSGDGSCIEFTQYENNLCTNDSVNSFSKTVLKVSPEHKSPCKSIESETNKSLRSTALNISLDSYTIERHPSPCPGACCNGGFILTVESFSAMIERISYKTSGPDIIGEPSAAYPEGEENRANPAGITEHLSKARENA